MIEDIKEFKGHYFSCNGEGTSFFFTKDGEEDPIITMNIGRKQLIVQTSKKNTKMQR